MMAGRIFRLVLAALLVVTVSCTRKAGETHRKDVTIVGAGATFPYPLYKNWIQEYQNAHRKVGISYDPVGSGEGVKKFLKEEVDFGASDAAMSDEEMAKAARGAKLIPATAGIVVLAYNLKDLNGTLKLPRDVYVGIFSGEINRWDDARIKAANPALNLPALEIVPVTRAESSGTTFAFTNHLSAVSASWREHGPGAGKVVQWPVHSMSARGNEGVAGRIKITDGAVGYVEYGYAQRAGLAMAALENREGKFVEPSPARGQDTLTTTRNDMPANGRMFFPDPPGENSYPIVTYSWILLHDTYPDPKKAEALRDFIKWGITDGQKFSEKLGFCVLPESVREHDLKEIDAIK